MKKIFTLLITTAMLSTAFAQYGKQGQRGMGNDKSNGDYVLNDNKGFNKYDKGYHGAYVFSPRERDMQIARINRQYDYKIRSVKNRFFMSWFQKKRLINNLKVMRDQEIHQVIHKFNSPKNKFGNHGKRNKRRW